MNRCESCGKRVTEIDAVLCDACWDDIGAGGSSSAPPPRKAVTGSVALGAPKPIAPRYVDPNSLEGLFQWCVAQSEPAAHIPPLAIHQGVMPRDHSAAPIKSGDIIRARPFTIAFERYVDGEDEDAPILQALADIHSDPSLRLEFELLWAVVLGGHSDYDLLRAVLGRPNGFDEAARRGLILLRDKTTAIIQKRVAETSQRRETAGAAQLARDEEAPKKKRKGKLVA